MNSQNYLDIKLEEKKISSKNTYAERNLSVYWWSALMLPIKLSVTPT